MGILLKAAAFLTRRQWTRWHDLTAKRKKSKITCFSIHQAKSRYRASGRDHRFEAIHSLATIARKSPSATTNVCVRTSSAANGEANALTAAPVLMFTRTSGSTGQPKLIPSPKPRAEIIASSPGLWYYPRVRGPSGIFFSGKLLGVVSPVVEGRTAGGIPFGAASGLIYQSIRVDSECLCDTYDIAEVKDFEASIISPCAWH